MNITTESAKPNRKPTRLILLAVGMLFLSHTSEATQIAYEGFSYPISSTISNQNSGTGAWMGPWIGANLGGLGADSSALDFVVTNGYSYTNDTGGYIAGSGGAIFDHDGSAHEEYRQWFDPSSDVSATWGTNIWFSFLATYDVASGSGGSVCLFEDAGDTTAGFGAAVTGPAGGGNFIVQIRAGAFGQGAASGPVANLQACQPGVNLVVGRLQLDPARTQIGTYFGNDRLDVWLNPSAEPTNGSSLFFSGFYAFTKAPYSSGYLGIRTGGGCQMTIDEIRIGTTYSDVVPVTAQSPNLPPTAPKLSMERSGPNGIQFNTSESTPTNSNEIVTFPGLINCSWVGQTPAAYTFTIAKPPARGPTNFMAYAWLIPNPNNHIQALDNPNAVQLALISDGHGSAKAVLGYYVNSSGTFQDNFQALLTTGVICGIPSAPFAGTWTISLTNDTDFTLTAPNGVQASGSMQAGDVGNFGSLTSFYLGVSPNGGSNVGTPSLGNYMTVSGVTITNTGGVIVQSDFSTGAALDTSKWAVLANFPSCIYVMPSNSVYRATWQNSCSPSAGLNSLIETNALGGPGNWKTAVPLTSLLSDRTNVAFVTTAYTTNSAGFFRVKIPYSP